MRENFSYNVGNLDTEMVISDPYLKSVKKFGKSNHTRARNL